MTDRLAEIEAEWKLLDSSPHDHFRDDVYRWALGHGDWLIAELKCYRKALEEIEEMGYWIPTIDIINASTCAAAALKGSPAE